MSMKKSIRSSGHPDLEPDWLLVYHIDEDVLVLSLVRTGTYSDIFNK